MSAETMSKDKISLVIANLLPLIGIAFFGWSLFNFLFLYWLESAVIGFYAVLKIIKAAKVRQGTTSVMLIVQGISFSIHYSFFMFGHLIFILAISHAYQSTINFNLAGFLFLIFNLIILFISHGISYRDNFIGKREYDKSIPFFTGFFPYNRILVMHTVVLFGSILVSMFNWPLYTVVVLKLFVDYLAHRRSHRIKTIIDRATTALEQAGDRLNAENIVAIRDKRDIAEALSGLDKKI